MKAIRYHNIQDVRLEDIDRPVMQEDEALIRVLYAGVCGSDLHIYNKGMFIRNVPETMGHEFVGVVEETGSLADSVAPGDLVVANPMVPCMECPACRAGAYNACLNLGFIGEVRQGCFAEYISLPAHTLCIVPPGSDLRQMALAEPLAVALNVCERAHLSPEDEMAVVGTGPIGLLTILVARNLYGVSSIDAVGRSGARLALAEQLGVRTAGRSLPKGAYYPKVIEAAGKEPTLQMALSHTAPNGRLCAVSIFKETPRLDLNLLVGAQISLTGCNAYEQRHIREAVSVLAEGRLDLTPILSEVVDLSDGAEAFQRLSRPDKKAAKILLNIGAH